MNIGKELKNFTLIPNFGDPKMWGGILFVQDTVCACWTHTSICSSIFFQSMLDLGIGCIAHVGNMVDILPWTPI